MDDENSKIKAHEQWCNCYGGKCSCNCRGYSGAVDELLSKLRVAEVALETIKTHKGNSIFKADPKADPAEVSKTYRIADNALTVIKDSVY